MNSTPADSPGAATALPPLPSASTTPPSRGTLAWFVLLLATTAVLCFQQLSGGARFEPIDCWVAQTAREMQANHDWLVPRFSGEVRMQKSPGPYWAVMLTSLIRGQPVDEVSARIPNGVAALLLVAIVFWLTRRIAGDRAAIFAGFACSASVLILWWSHRGASDLGLTTLTTLSLASIWIGSESAPPGWKRIALWLLGYFAAGLAMLYKMPMPLVVIGLPAVLYVLLLRRWSILRSPWHLLGLVLFLLPWLPWAVAVSIREEAALAKWKVEFFDRFTGDLPNVEGQSNLKYMFTYLAPAALYCLPFTLSLPGAFVRAFRKNAGVNRNGTLCMVIWFVSLLVFFTVSAGKEWRYLLPALPPLFVLLGIELAAFFDPHRPPRPRLERIGAIAVWVLVPVGLGLGVIGLHFWWKLRGHSELEGWATWATVWHAYLVAAAIMTVGFGIAAWSYLRRRPHLAFALMVVTMWTMWPWAWWRIFPLMSSQRPFFDFAKQVNEVVPANLTPHLVHLGSQDSRIIWYGNFRIPRLIDQLKLLEEEHYKRSLNYEIRRYGEELVSRLRGPEPILCMSPLESYIRFLLGAPPELAKVGETMPRSYLWLQTRYGREDTQFVVFGNRPPPYPEPELRLPDKLRAKLRAVQPTTAVAASAPAASAPSSSPASGGG